MTHGELEVVVKAWLSVAENTAAEWEFVAAGLKLDCIHYGQSQLVYSCEGVQWM